VEAAGFLARALESARALPEVSASERAEVAEWLGDAHELAGRYPEARAAYKVARRLRAGDPLAQAALHRKTGTAWERQGEFSVALRAFQRGFAVLDGAAMAGHVAVEEGAVRRRRAELTTTYGAVQLRQGRHLRAKPVLEEAVRLASGPGVGDTRGVLAHAYRLLDWIHIELGLPEPMPYPQLSLALYDQLGDELGRFNVFNNMGIAAYYDGRWEEAASLYGQALEAVTRAGDMVHQALVLNNLAEIRSDQGRIDEAESLLREALGVWRSTKNAMTGMTLGNLGRAAARDGRLDEAASWYDEARSFLTRVRAKAMLLETDARDAERMVLGGACDDALRLGRDVERRARELGGNPYVLMLAERVQGYALAQAGAAREGWALLTRSVLRAREDRAPYEAALGLQGVARVTSMLGVDGASFATEAAELFARLGVVRTPDVPLG
jgi:tetratricopeptide (TPR) repeat protein